MRKSIITLIAIVACLASLVRVPASTQDKPPTPAEGELYSTIISQELSSWRATHVLLADKTLSFNEAQGMREFFDALKQKNDGVPPELIAGFEKLNAKAYQIDGSSVASQKVALVAPGGMTEYIRSLVASGKGTPQSIIRMTFSRAAFNQRMDQALVYVSWTCGLSECAQWGFKLLKKEGGIWKGTFVGPRGFS